MSTPQEVRDLAAQVAELLTERPAALHSHFIIALGYELRTRGYELAFDDNSVLRVRER